MGTDDFELEQRADLTMPGRPWFRMYARFATDPDVQMLAFEDQRHFAVLLCLKCSGLIDKPYQDEARRERVIAAALGLEPMWAAEAKRRLLEAELIDADWQPRNWDDLQFESDSSTARVQRHRAAKRRGNVSVTPPDTDTDTEKTPPNSPPGGNARAGPPADEFEARFARFREIYPRRNGHQRWPQARKHVRARLREGHTWGEILSGVERYRRWVRGTGKGESEVVLQAATFVGPNKAFLEDWRLPEQGDGRGGTGGRAGAGRFEQSTDELRRWAGD